ncbi:formyltetrahydrofolate deformylase [Salinisphaera sp. USBA-960]|uniref:formyltetrahydrofolate deformylase n=1 Tax=Salinisphaera orenii TaxID=856731 RepID=UPI000DBE174C|nr:formyltetrahydrofolate deformylase [Salifodinibacter halophilus]NNC26896.1 formyltetrahydrofolate deformylase [Salifodinibacter halophilus]
MDDDNKYGQAFILNAVSPGQVGTVAMIAGFLAELECYIVEMSQHDDSRTGNFLARTMFRTSASRPLSPEYIREHFAERVGDWPMTWQLYDPNEPIPALIMVSKADHCLLTLLYRQRLGELNIDIRGIVSNHPDLEEIAVAHGVPFYYMPVTAETKPEQEQAVLDLMNEQEADLLILARYMQILSDKLCSALFGRAINIHHSFLPGFKGARPYEQAFKRGVKVIGATAHYVTTDLDEGPIIEQVVQRVDNPYSPKDLASVGRDIETWALARAVKLHVERRVFIEGQKTIVFR